MQDIFQKILTISVMLIVLSEYFRDGSGYDIFSCLLPATRGGNIDVLKYFMPLIPGGKSRRGSYYRLLIEALDFEQYNCAEYILQSYEINFKAEWEKRIPIPYANNEKIQELLSKYCK